MSEKRVVPVDSVLRNWSYGTFREGLHLTVQSFSALQVANPNKEEVNKLLCLVEEVCNVPIML